jgi:type IV secretory pathway VirB10-like protein
MMNTGAPVKEEPVPLPLPKNLVLVGMIEAAERQARLLEENQTEDDDSLDMSDAVNDDDDDDDEERTRLDPTLAGMSAFVGPCGTYAVREALGLAVLPSNPNKQHQSHKDEKRSDLLNSSSEEEKKVEEPREPFTIEEGQRVQVIGVDEGVYVLARGAGYIVATVNQLVKSTSLSLSRVHASFTMSHYFVWC